MIRYVPHNEVDFEKWDHCIDHSVNGIFYAYSWYLNMAAPGWDALVEGDYLSVMPLPKRVKFGIQYVFQPYFIQQLGVFSTRSISGEVVGRFIKAIPEKFRFVDYNLNTFNQLFPSALCEQKHKTTHHLDLIESYDAISHRYSTNTRRNIGKARKMGVFVTEHGSPDEIITAFRLNRGRRLRSFGKNDYQLLKRLIYSGLHRGFAKIFTAYSSRNSFCGGAVFFHSHNKSVLLFTASTVLSRENGAMFLIIDEYIRKMAGQKVVLDFEGSENPQLARFYKGFDSKECIFLQIKVNRMPWGIKTLSNLYLNWKNGKRKSTD